MKGCFKYTVLLSLLAFYLGFSLPEESWGAPKGKLVMALVPVAGRT